MPAAADQRLLELLDQWLASLDLHQKYSSLDDAAYRRAQDWPEHQRPSRWIIDLAKQKTSALKAEVERRMSLKDEQFSDSMEMMAFLANLVGSEHIERFIPLAHAADERVPRDSAAGDDADTEAALHAVPVGDATREMASSGASGTREMPAFARPAAKPAPPVSQTHVTRLERRSTERGAPERSASRASSEPSGMSAEAREQVIADAVRLTQWGRKWYELAELISRMADRPPLPDVRRLLKDHKAEIERMAGRAP